jgi:hypothetical protein
MFNRIVEAGTSRWTAVLNGASAELRARDFPEIDDLPGSGHQPTLLVELAACDVQPASAFAVSLPGY